MKANRKAILIVLLVLAFILSTVGVIAFVFGAINAATASPTTSGTNGNSYNWMSGSQWSNMMGGNMMGGNWGTPSSSPTPVAVTAQNSILPLAGLVTLVGAALTGAGGAAYFFIGRSKIALSQAPLTINPVSTVESTPSTNTETPIDTVSKTLTVDERKVVNVLISHNGQYLQKYIRNETGLSRLKIHRIVTRLSERGIVTLEQSGNTNKVYLSNWLAKQPFSKINDQENTGYFLKTRP